MKQKKKKKRGNKKRVAPATPQSPSHQRDFDQLLDDAIFGVKKPTRRG